MGRALWPPRAFRALGFLPKEGLPPGVYVYGPRVLLGVLGFVAHSSVAFSWKEGLPPNIHVYGPHALLGVLGFSGLHALRLHLGT